MHRGHRETPRVTPPRREAGSVSWKAVSMVQSDKPALRAALGSCCISMNAASFRGSPCNAALRPHRTTRGASGVCHPVIALFPVICESCIVLRERGPLPAFPLAERRGGRPAGKSASEVIEHSDPWAGTVHGSTPSRHWSHAGTQGRRVDGSRVECEAIMCGTNGVAFHCVGDHDG